MAFDHMRKGTWVASTSSGYRRDRLYARGIDTVYFSPLDPGAPVHIAAVRAEGRIPGIYSDPHWYGLHTDGNALRYRQQLDADIVRLLRPGEPFFPDLELTSLDYQYRLFCGSPGNRGLCRSQNPNAPTGTQQGRPVRFTDMPFQNHTVVNLQVFAEVPELQWAPQLYYGDMSPASEAAVIQEVQRELDFYAPRPLNANANRVHPFYDAARYTTDQRDGDYFTAERFPGMFGALTRRTAARAWIMDKQQLRNYYTRVGGEQ